MAVAAITIAVIAAMTNILVAVIPNPRVDNRSKRIVRKFRIYFDKKLKVDKSLSYARRTVNFLLYSHITETLG
jgi:hypothetical protein